MNKILTMIGASTLTLGVMIGGAEARKISYEINGQRYTYESSDPRQVAAARKRIEAANAADAARAKAEAERAANPLVGIFGSQVQREAAEAKARLEQLLAEQPPQAEPAARRQRASQASQDEQTAKEADNKPEGPPAAEQTQANAAEASQAAPEAKPAGTPDGQSATKPMVKSVSFDVESGIKTTIMTDGSVQEEPFDSNLLARLNAEHSGSESLTAFVNRLRKETPEEATGSTVKAARPD